MRISFILVITALFGAIFLSNCNLALAFGEGDEIGYSQIHPASSLYFLKAVREVMELKFAGTERTIIIRNFEFATRRIREVKSLEKAGREDLISPTLERYSLYLNYLQSHLNTFDDGLVIQVGDNLAKHVAALDDLIPKLEDLSAKALTRLTLHRISEYNSILIGKLDGREADEFADTQRERQKIICSILQKEASSSALSEIERGVIQKRVKLCLDAI